MIVTIKLERSRADTLTREEGRQEILREFAEELPRLLARHVPRDGISFSEFKLTSVGVE